MVSVVAIVAAAVLDIVAFAAAVVVVALTVVLALDFGSVPDLFHVSF